MQVSSAGGEHTVRAAFYLVQGLGLLPNVIVEQHFGRRGRMVVRLIGAAVENSRLLGIGVDEDSALFIDRTSECRVAGSGSANMFAV